MAQVEEQPNCHAMLHRSYSFFSRGKDLQQSFAFFGRDSVFQHLMSTINDVVFDATLEEKPVAERETCQNDQVLVDSTRVGSKLLLHVDDIRICGC